MGQQVAQLHDRYMMMMMMMIDLKEIGQESEQINFVQNRDERQAFMKMTINIWDP
jgi:hypothetical protein